MKKEFPYLLVHLVFLIMPATALAFLGFDVDTTGFVSTGYDDNVTLDDDNEISDAVTELSTGLVAIREAKTYDLNIRGVFTRRLYATHSALNNDLQDIAIDFSKEFSKYDHVSMTNRFVHAEDPGSLKYAFGRTSGRYSYYRNNFDAAYIRDMSKHFSIEGRYDHETYSVSRDDLSDSMMHRVGIAAVYIRNSALSFLLGYDFTMRRLEGSGRADVHTFSTGIRYSLTKRSYFDGRCGVSLVDAFDGSRAFRPSVTLTLTNDFDETDSITLTYRKISMPSSDTADIWNSWQTSLEVSRQWSARLKTALSVFLGVGEFAALKIEDRQIGVEARLNYDVRENVAVFLTYTRSEVDSDVDSRDYRRNQVAMGVRMTF